MKIILIISVLVSSLSAFAATKEECLGGNFASCKDLFNQFGATSDRTGAVELFEKACSAQSLKVSCLIVSSTKADTVKKTMELASPNMALFTINGPKIDKIYKFTEVK